MDIKTRITLKNGKSYLTAVNESILFFATGKLIEFYDNKLELRRVETNDIYSMDIVQS